MWKLDIDISGVVDTYNLLLDQSKQLSTEILDRMVNEFMINWETNVSNKLNKTKGEYLRAMEVDRIDEYNAIIKLTDRHSKLPLMIEEGAGPFDIKDGLEASSKRKTSVGGDWYIDVPFRFATTKAAATSPVFTGGVAPGGVINKAKKAQGRPVPVQNLAKKFRSPKSRLAIPGRNFTIPEYKHQVSIYDRIRRVEVGAGTGKKRGAYYTFRRVSDASDQYSWIHRGFRAQKFMDFTLATTDFDPIVNSVIQNFLAKI